MNAIRTLHKLAVLLLMAGLAVGGGSPVPVAQANNANPGVIPPQAVPYGHTYAEWTGRWSQWVFSRPGPVNPEWNDPTGAYCAEGQAGPVWFLASNGGGTLVRDCTVPAGKALLVNIMFVECSNVEGPPFHGDTEAELRDCARYWLNPLELDAASVDGVPLTGLLPTYRFQSPYYSLALPDQNVYQTVFGMPEVTGGTVFRSVSDGFFVMLAPLPAGPHTIHFAGHGTGEVSWLVWDITYHLTVGR
jgi:hypothetical protein